MPYIYISSNGLIRNINTGKTLGYVGLGKFKLSPKGLLKLGLKLDPLKKYTGALIKAQPGEPIMGDVLKEVRAEVEQERREEREREEAPPSPPTTAEILSVPLPKSFLSSLQQPFDIGSLKPYLPYILIGFGALIVLSVVMKPKSEYPPRGRK